MSIDTTPQWDLADRLRKSLREADIGVSEMADYLEVGRNTVSNWINGRNTPPGAAMRLWAMRCGVPLEWLKGAPGPGITPDSGGTTRGYSPVIRLGLRRFARITLNLMPPLAA